MILLKFKCDRCHVVVDDGNQENWTDIEFSGEHQTVEDVDLCGGCSRELKEWIESFRGT